MVSPKIAVVIALELNLIYGQDYLYTLVTEQLDPIVSPNRRESTESARLGSRC